MTAEASESRLLVFCSLYSWTRSSERRVTEILMLECLLPHLASLQILAHPRGHCPSPQQENLSLIVNLQMTALQAFDLLKQ